MNKTHKTLTAVAITSVIGLSAYLINQNTQPEQAERPSQAAHNPRPRPEPVAKDPELRALRMERDALAESLEQAEADRDAAMHSAQLYKELVQLPLEDRLKKQYPTRRHVTAATGSVIGRMIRLQTEANKDPSVDLGGLPPEEAQRIMAEATKIMNELMALHMADQAFLANPDGDKLGDPSDHAAVFAYGALKLDEQQFQQMHELIQRTRDEAESAKLLAEPADGTTMSERMDPLMDLSGKAQREMQDFLTPEQAGMLEGLGPDFPFAWGQPSGASAASYMGSDQGGSIELDLE